MTIVEERGVGSRSGGEGVVRSEGSPVLRGLQEILDQTDSVWSLGLVGEDQAGKLATLTGDLRGRYSEIGEGKRITSGFSYLGAEPAIAWLNACRDRLYPVMRESIESFERRWPDLRAALGSRPYHYVSLGPGDGQKDEIILRDFRRDNANLCYVGVDMSGEMLRLGVHDLIRRLPLAPSRILPVQLDFSDGRNVAALRHLLDSVFNGEPVLFSLLGNTMANFDDDAELLRMLAGKLLGDQDRMLLEVATTTARLDKRLAQDAADEYERSRSFREFVTSALMHYTDLQIDMDSVLFEGSVEDERALRVIVMYQNRTGREIRLTLPDRTNVSFPVNDTIRLYVTRKYAQQSLDSTLLAAGVRKIHGTHYDCSRTGRRASFGVDLVLLRREGNGVTVGDAEASMAEAIWRP